MLGNLLDFAGGLMSERRQSRQHKSQMELAKSQFAQQMDHGVRRRVEDAKRAGVHPLFALGASVGASPTASAPGPTGSAMGRALSRVGARLSAAQLEKESAGAKRDEAEAALLDAQRKKLEQEMVSRGHDGASVTNQTGDGLQYGPPAYEAPVVASSSRPGFESGVHPMWREYVDHRGYTWSIPAEGLNADEIGQVKLAINAMASHGLGWRDAIGDVWKSATNRVKRVISGQWNRAPIRYKERKHDPDTDWIAP